MKSLFVCLLFLVLSFYIVADESILKIEKINKRKIDEITYEELLKIEQIIDFKTLAVEKILLIVKNTNDSDYIDFLIENENKYSGFSRDPKVDTTKATDPLLKSRIDKYVEKDLTFRSMAKKINLLHTIRKKAVSYLSDNRNLLKNTEDLFLDLQPFEIAIFKECSDKNLKHAREYSGSYGNYYRIKKEAFKISIDLPLQMEINNKKFSAKEILNKIYESEKYLTYQNINLVKRIMSENDKDNSWEDLLLALKLWKDFDTFERHLIENPFIHGSFRELIETVFQIITNKNYSEKKSELEKILGEKLYQSVFEEKVDLLKIPELSFDSEIKLLNGIK